MARRLALVAVVLAALAAFGGCGDDENGGTGGGSSSSSGGGYADTPGESDSSDPGTEASSGAYSSCDGAAYPVPVGIPEQMQGFVRLCASQNSRSIRVDNIAHMVVLVRPNNQRQTYTDLTPPPATLSSLAIRQFARTSCGDPWCQLPPGSSIALNTTDPEPVHIILDFGWQDTVAATWVRVAIEELAGRIQRQNAAQRLANCAQGVQSTLEGANWEEAFMSAAGSAPGCTALFNEAFGVDDAARQSSIRRMLSKARQLSGGTWADVALLGAKALTVR